MGAEGSMTGSGVGATTGSAVGARTGSGVGAGPTPAEIRERESLCY